MERDLIFDLGMHRGEDSEFYLKKGFRVVAVEANPDLCRIAGARLAAAVADGRLTIVFKAVAGRSGPVTFYETAGERWSVWGTCKPEWAERNRRHGAESVERTVEAVTLAELMRTYGVPYYAKIDIEGLDRAALRSLGDSGERPPFVSLESDKMSFGDLRGEFELLTGLGYDRFKLVPQHKVHRQRPPRPAREGRYVRHRFERGSSGLFGREIPGRWLTAEQAVERYRAIFLRYALVGDEGYVRHPLARRALRRLGVPAGWYDTHARHREAAR